MNNQEINKSIPVFSPLGKKGLLVILGGGESGVGTAILGKQKGYKVFVSDRGEISKKYKEVLLNNEIDFEENQHTESKIVNADVVMKSPGIPDKVELVKKLKEKGIPVISEIEFAAQFTDAKIIGITGSNGKTTTTLLVHHILRKAGLNVGVAGNIGDSFAQQVAENKYENYVLELSSFQLDGIENFNSHIAILTNITPDHLDRYEYDFNNYIASKFRITKNQTATDYLIYDADDEAINNWLKVNKTQAKLVPFSLEKELEKVRKQTIMESLEDFEGAEHRLENVAKIRDVEYINDSKATNVNATFYALECMDKPTVWIVGGVDKGNDYNDLLALVREKVKAIVCLGLDNEKIKKTFGNVVDIIVETAGAEEAVKVSHKLADRGDAVLLSPACASFDLFDNYEDRGRQFKEAVRSL